MATIIEALLVTLGLDASGMRQGADDAAKAQEKIEQDAEKSAKGVTAAGKKRDAEASAALKKRAAEESAAAKKKSAEEAKAVREREAGAKKMAEGLGKVRNEILGVMAAFIGFAAIKGFGGQLISTDLQAKRLSETLDVSISKLSAWQDAGAKFGASADDVADAFRKANNMQMEFNRGNIEPVKDIMMQAGIEKVSFDTTILDRATSAEDRLKKLADVAQKMTAKGAQYAFGKAGFSEADIRMLRAGGTELDKLVQHFKGLNPDLESASKGSEELAGQWVEVKAQAKGIGNSILDVLLPALKLGLTALSGLLGYAREHVPATIAIVGALGVAFVALSAKSMLGTVTMMANVVRGLGAVGGAAGATAAEIGVADTAALGFAGTLSTLLGGLAAAGGAFAAGYAFGTAIYEGLIAGTSLGDWIGKTEARVLAFFGSKEAQASLDANEKKKPQPATNGGAAKKLNDEIMRGGEGAPLAKVGKPNIRPPAPNIAPALHPDLAKQAGSQTAVPATATNTPPEIIHAAQASQEKYGIPAEVTIAQWKLESNHGKSMPEGSNNPFGIKAKDGQPYVESDTKEFINGQMQKVKAKFAKFDSLEDAFDAHAKLLATGSAYADARTHKDNPFAFADALTGHYATDPLYGQKLKTVMGQDRMPAQIPAQMQAQAATPATNAPTAVAVPAPAVHVAVAPATAPHIAATPTAAASELKPKVAALPAPAAPVVNVAAQPVANIAAAPETKLQEASSPVVAGGVENSVAHIDQSRSVTTIHNAAAEVPRSVGVQSVAVDGVVPVRLVDAPAVHRAAESPQPISSSLQELIAQMGRTMQKMMAMQLNVDPSILRALEPGPAIDRGLLTGAQSSVSNFQTSNVNNQVANSQQVETHIGAVHINAPQAKTNGDVGKAMGEGLNNYAFAAMSNLGLA